MGSVGVGYSHAHGGDGAAGPQPDDGVRVFHEVGEGREAAARQALDFAAGEFSGLGGEAVEFVAEAFVFEPAVVGPFADTDFEGGLAPIG